VVLTFTDIGLLKTTREALSKRETRLSSLYRAVPVGIGRIANRMFLEVNDHLCEMLGYAREELVGQSSRMLYLSQEDFESVGQDSVRTDPQPGRGDGGNALAVQGRHDFAGLDQRLVAESREPGRRGDLHRLDLSMHKAALARMNESEHLVRATLDALNAPIAILDETGTILAINKAWRDSAPGNAGTLDRLTEGANYLRACDSVQGDAIEDAAAFAEGIRAVLRGERERFEQGYPRHAPTEQLRFVGRVTRLPGEGPARAVVAHEPAGGGALA
jgi:PAS domain-containing protein